MRKGWVKHPLRPGMAVRMMRPILTIWVYPYYKLVLDFYDSLLTGDEIEAWTEHVTLGQGWHGHRAEHVSL